VPRWVAVGLGCVSALGMQVLFEIVAGATGVARWPAAHYLAVFGALVIGGYVAGHLVGRYSIFNGALASVLYIFVTVTLNALREAPLAQQYGLNALPPIDLLQLTITDVLAMTGASWGGWLAGRLNRGDEGFDRVDR
jgi:hypothetical protein